MDESPVSPCVMNTINLYDEMSKINKLDFFAIPPQFFRRG